VNHDRDAFGPRLRHERERRGITLEAIAESTKISRPLLAALERNDVSRWPLGIFRRAFIREYAAAIGLAPEPIVDEFVRLFPEPGTEPAACEPSAPPPPLRMTLAREHLPRALRAPVARPLAAVLDACVIVVLSWLVAWVTGAGVLSAAGLLALAYYTVTLAAWGRTPALRLLTAGAEMPRRADARGAAVGPRPVETRASDGARAARREPPPQLRRAGGRHWRARGAVPRGAERSGA
jgi:transcriptional regulator with XRE-family HTH domain